MTTVFIPDPSLVLLVGAAGAGKTTFAARHFAPGEILSSDAFRAIIAGDEADQAASATAFAILHREVERRLLAGRLAVVDATNADRRHRRTLLRRAETAGVPAVALVLALPAGLVLGRNRTRPRQVDETVVRTQLARVRHSLGPTGLATEGYASVWVARTPEEADEVVLERLRQPPTR